MLKWNISLEILRWWFNTALLAKTQTPCTVQGEWDERVFCCLVLVKCGLGTAVLQSSHVFQAFREPRRDFQRCSFRGLKYLSLIHI